jgi:hypothetical protein
MAPALYAIVHLFVYGSWRTVANKEKRIRSDGKHIPRYATGGIGNAIGFTLIAISVGLVHPLPTLNELIIAVISGLLVCFFLDRLWRKSAMHHTVSLYLRNGQITPAGKLHLVYVILVSSLIVILLISWRDITGIPALLSITGILIYTCAVVIDRARKII